VPKSSDLEGNVLIGQTTSADEKPMLAIFWPEEQGAANVAPGVSPFLELMDTDWKKALAVLQTELELPLNTRGSITWLESEVARLEADAQRERRRREEEAKAMLQLVQETREQTETDMSEFEDQTKELMKRIRHEQGVNEQYMKALQLQCCDEAMETVEQDRKMQVEKADSNAVASALLQNVGFNISTVYHS
jgi:hypothetical protein